MAPARRSPRPVWLNTALVLLAAALFGLLVLPRLAPDPIVGKPARDFALPRLVPGGGLSGEKVRLSELEGKAVILDFWASWCAPCRAQAPVVERVAKAHLARGLTALGVVSNDTPEDAGQFLATHPLAYASVVDDQGDVARAFDVQGLPTLVALDKTGAVVARRTGFVSEQELNGIVEAALK